MASIGQLVRAVSQVSGIEEASVKLIARYIREAGFVSQQSTGAGAAQMSSGDAASILIAVNAASLAKDASKAVEEFGSLKLEYITEFQPLDPNSREMHALISRSVDFNQALIGLIEMYANEPGVFAMIEFTRPRPQVFVRLWRSDDELHDLNTTDLNCVFSSKNRPAAIGCDRSVRVNITHRTLRHVAKALNN